MYLLLGVLPSQKQQSTNWGLNQKKTRNHRAGDMIAVFGHNGISDEATVLAIRADFHQLKRITVNVCRLYVLPNGPSGFPSPTWNPVPFLKGNGLSNGS